MLRRLRSLRHAIVRRREFETAMTEELRFHLEAVTDDLVRRGVPRDEAERRARVQFGGVEHVKDECR